jgi:hypothetical protein
MTIISDQKRYEFNRLYREFIDGYPPTKEGRNHVLSYDRCRQEAQRNYDEILAAVERGEDVTDRVLLQLLPYSDTKANRDQGAWIHLAPAITGDLKKWFENLGRATADDWPKVAEDLLRFIRRSVDDPNQLEAACKEYSQSPYSKGFQTGMLTPVLNALRPQDYCLVNNKSRSLINYFGGAKYGQSITFYPSINRALKQLLTELGDELAVTEHPSLSPADALDMFSHWLWSIKKFYDHADHVDRTSNKAELRVAETMANHHCPFTTESFELLERLHSEPTSQFYQANKVELQELVEGPFKRVFNAVAERLPDVILERMETKKNLFSRFLKNDFGQGGAWDFLWAAFYPTGSRRAVDAQLTLWLYYERMEAGFYIGTDGAQSRARFAGNASRFSGELVELLTPWLDRLNLVYGPDVSNQRQDGQAPDLGANRSPNLAEWLQNPDIYNYDVKVIWSRETVLQMSETELVEWIAKIHTRLFPLALLAMLDDPMLAIRDYLGMVEESPGPLPIAPIYSMEDFSNETGVHKDVIESWVRAIERKGQVILYGPPGTGKTYLAERLARHLISGGDGFIELVQFHPAYAYEDFVQGIRPQTLPDGGLSYPLVPGRLLQFCAEAQGRRDPCLLIIDEINRANLSRVFGELMYLLEYRDQEIKLAGGGPFRLPENVRIIGTMNTADRSIALVDHALRRRFAFLALHPDMDVLRRYHQRQKTGFTIDNLIGVIETLNQRIGDPHYSIGISYFLLENLTEQIADIWRMEIEPYLVEYFFDQPDAAAEFTWEKIGGRILS